MASLANTRQERLPLVIATHGGAATSGRPHRGNHATNSKTFTGNLVGQGLNGSVVRIDTGVRFKKEKIDTVKTGAVYFGLRRHIEHGV